MSPEEETLAHGQQVLESCSEQVPVVEYQQLLRSFQKLSKDLHRLLRISDKNESRLQSMGDALALEKKRLESIAQQLSLYLPRQIYLSIFEGQQTVEVKPQRKLLTIFFSDIKDFTRISETLQPEQLTLVMNEYFSDMSAVATEHGGTIDKFIGDSIMIFFGDPQTLGPEADALQAVRMAVAMQKRIAELNLKWKREGLQHPVSVRMGINTGWCTVGNFGSQQRMSYTILGGEVNLTSRIEGVCDPGGIFLSFETFSRVKDHVITEARGEIQLKGIARPVSTYAVKSLVSGNERAHSSLIVSLPGQEPVSIDPWRLSLQDKVGLLTQLKSLAQQLEQAAIDHKGQS